MVGEGWPGHSLSPHKICPCANHNCSGLALARNKEPGGCSLTPPPPWDGEENRKKKGKTLFNSLTEQQRKRKATTIILVKRLHKARGKPCNVLTARYTACSRGSPPTDTGAQCPMALTTPSVAVPPPSFPGQVTLPQPTPGQQLIKEVTENELQPEDYSHC